jgi:hypothetical protein
VAETRSPAYDGNRVVIVEVVTSEERFLVVCPCAAIISDDVIQLLAQKNLAWTFGKAIVRPRHTSAMFVCVDPTDNAHGLWVSAAWIAPGDWMGSSPMTADEPSGSGANSFPGGYQHLNCERLAVEDGASAAEAVRKTRR